MLVAPADCLGQHLSSYENIQRLAEKGALYTATYVNMSAGIQQKINDAKLHKDYASIGVIAILAFAVIFGSTIGPLIGVVCLCGTVLSVAFFRKADTQQKQCEQFLRNERIILSNIYTNMASYFVAKRDEREKEILKGIRRGRCSNYYEVEHAEIEAENALEHASDIQLANRIKSMVNPIDSEFVTTNYVYGKYRYLNYTPWGHLKLVCDLYIHPDSNVERYLHVTPVDDNSKVKVINSLSNLVSANF